MNRLVNDGFRTCIIYIHKCASIIKFKLNTFYQQYGKNGIFMTLIEFGTHAEMEECRSPKKRGITRSVFFSEVIGPYLSINHWFPLIPEAIEKKRLEEKYETKNIALRKTFSKRLFSRFFQLF